MVKTFIITGDTWSSRDDLKNLGGRWVPHLNAWFVPYTERKPVVSLRDEIGFDVQLVSLPIDLPFSVRNRMARSQTAVPSPISSPTAS